MISHFYEKKTVIYVTLTVFLISILSSCSRNAYPILPTVVVSPLVQTVKSGDTVTINIDAKRILNVFGAAMDVVYDPSILQYETSTEGSFFSGSGTTPTRFLSALENGTEGDVVIGVSQLAGSEAVSGDGQIASITFKVIGSNCSTKLSLKNTALIGPNGQNIPINTIGNAIINVTGNAGITATSLSNEGVIPNYTSSYPIHQIQLLKSTNDYTLIEFTSQTFKIKSVQHEGIAYQKIIYPDAGYTNEIGKPQLPVKGTLIGIPYSATISVKIVKADYTDYTDYNIYPVPAVIAPVPMGNSEKNKIVSLKHVFYINQSFYESNIFYPSAPAKIDYTGILRHQQVARIVFYPFQFNPFLHKLRVYKTITVKIEYHYDNNLLTSNVKPISYNNNVLTKYDQIYKHVILNYESIKARSLNLSSISISSTLNKFTQLSPHTTQQTAQRIKIEVSKDGIYKLDYQTLVNAGFNLNGIDPNRLMMTSDGVEIPIFVHETTNGTFGPSDYILFYGTGINTQYSNENAYWLQVGGYRGLRMSERSVNIQYPSTTLSVFSNTVTFQQNKYYWPEVPEINGTLSNPWFWDQIIWVQGNSSIPVSSQYSFSLQGVSTTSATANLEVNLFGASYPASSAPSHHCSIYLNGYFVGDAYWSGQTPYMFTQNIPQSYLNTGNNVLTLEEPGDLNVSVDVFYLRDFEITYWQSYTAFNNELTFYSNQLPESGYYNFNISDFSTSSLNLFDITNPMNPIILTNFSLLPSGAQYTLQFQDEKYNGINKKYIALSPNNYLVPDKVELINSTGNLISPANGADYIIITPDIFYNDIIPLVKLRESEGLRVTIATTEDIYNEFSYGIFTPQAIKDFLTYAYFNWQPPSPTYVLFVGGASYDYRNYLGYGNNNFVPTYYIYEPTYSDSYGSYGGYTASDNWFVSVNGSGDFLPDMLLGRLPVDNSEALDNIVNKIIEYDTNKQFPIPLNSWERNALFVADDWFEYGTDSFASYLPNTYNISKIYQPRSPTEILSDTNPLQQVIVNAINNGQIIVAYYGHGGPRRWAHEGMFLSSNLAQLNNYQKYPFIAAMACQNGMFDDPTIKDNIATQAVIAKDSGAIAFLASTNLVDTSSDELFGESLFSAFFNDNDHIIGSAAAEAKIQVFANYMHDAVIDEQTLFGDPAIKLPLLTIGDINGDGRVDGLDLIALCMAYGSSPGSPNWNIYADLNKDGHIGNNDFILLQKNFGISDAN